MPQTIPKPHFKEKNLVKIGSKYKGPKNFLAIGAVRKFFVLSYFLTDIELI